MDKMIGLDMTFEVILNIKGNMSPKKVRGGRPRRDSTREQKSKGKTPFLPPLEIQKSQYNEQSILSTMKIDNLPNLLKSRAETESVLQNFSTKPLKGTFPFTPRTPPSQL